MKQVWGPVLFRLMGKGDTTPLPRAPGARPKIVVVTSPHSNHVRTEESRLHGGAINSQGAWGLPEGPISCSHYNEEGGGGLVLVLLGSNTHSTDFKGPNMFVLHAELAYRQ